MKEFCKLIKAKERSEAVIFKPEIITGEFHFPVNLVNVFIF